MMDFYDGINDSGEHNDKGEPNDQEAEISAETGKVETTPEATVSEDELSAAFEEENRM